jgi:hypothetical protein
MYPFLDAEGDRVEMCAVEERLNLAAALEHRKQTGPPRTVRDDFHVQTCLAEYPSHIFGNREFVSGRVYAYDSNQLLTQTYDRCLSY